MTWANACSDCGDQIDGRELEVPRGRIFLFQRAHEGIKLPI
jgi:hypothetical protein